MTCDIKHATCIQTHTHIYVYIYRIYIATRAEQRQRHIQTSYMSIYIYRNSIHRSTYKFSTIYTAARQRESNRHSKPELLPWACRCNILFHHFCASCPALHVCFCQAQRRTTAVLCLVDPSALLAIIAARLDYTGNAGLKL